MGIYVNPGNTAFEEAVNSMIYVDKSKLISYTNRVLKTKQKNLCVSRPRRFGKSMAADMLVAYYSKGCDSKGLFAGLDIEGEDSFPIHLNQHDVIHVDVQRFLETKRDLDTFIKEMESRIISELVKEFPGWNESGAGDRLKDVLDQIFNQTKTGFIFIIDEWDCVFRMAKDRQEIQKDYLDFLRGIFKGAEYVELAYMTGILPIKKYGEHSAINVFKEFSMLNPGKIAECFGFTESEVIGLCEEHFVDYQETRKWYDGYLVGNLHIYNPQAVIELMDNGDFQSYWIGTETYEALKIYIDMDFDGLGQAVMEMLGGGRCKINTRKFQNDMTTFRTKDDVLTLLIHLGYLTYDRKTSETFIPNQEISQEFLNAADGPGWTGLIQALERSEGLLQSTWKLDGDAVATGIAVIHGETASILKYNNENSLTCTVLMAYYSAKIYYMNPVMEMPAGKGFADIVYLPKRNVDKPALLVELKWKGSPEGAIAQIKERKYMSWIEGYTGKILLVGINYNEDKEHECVIEEYVIE